MPTNKFFAGCLRDIATLVQTGHGAHVAASTINEAAEALDPAIVDRPAHMVALLRECASWLHADGHELLASMADDLAASVADAYHVAEEAPPLVPPPPIVVTAQPFIPDEAACEELLELMHTISEDLWAAGWRVGLEYDLWSAVVADGRRRSAAAVWIHQSDLASLADAAGGWWVHCSTVDAPWAAETEGPTGAPGRRFLPIAEWVALYAAEVAKGDDVADE